MFHYVTNRVALGVIVSGWGAAIILYLWWLTDWLVRKLGTTGFVLWAMVSGTIFFGVAAVCEWLIATKKGRL